MIVYYEHLRPSEKDREDAIRAVGCPVCLTDEGQRCVREGRARSISCTGRYDLAAQAGLVPKMAGVK